MSAPPYAIVWQRRRDELGLGLQDLAERLGISLAALHGYLHGTNVKPIKPERRVAIDTELAIGRRVRGERAPVYLLALMDGAEVRGWMCEQVGGDGGQLRPAALRSVELADFSVALMRGLGVEAAPVPAWRRMVEELAEAGGDPEHFPHGNHLLDGGSTAATHKLLTSLLADYAVEALSPPEPAEAPA